MSIKITKRGDNLRFQLEERVDREDFKRIVGIEDCWYYKGFFYLKEHALKPVKNILRELGFIMRKVTTESESKILQANYRIVATIDKLYNFKTQWVCQICQQKINWNNRMPRCPQHGYARKPKKTWYATALGNVAEEKTMLLLFGDCFTSLLHKGKFTKTELADKLKGLPDNLYKAQIEEIKSTIFENIQGKEFGLIGDLIEWKPNGDTVTFFRAKKMMSDRDLRVFQSMEKFVKGELLTIERIAQKVLPDYDTETKFHGSIPVITLTKRKDKETIQIGIRAPVGDYGKAYHLWLRINNVHIFPAAPVELKVFGHPVETWTYRIFHTKNWEERIEKRLQYFKDIEKRGLALANKLREITNFEIGEVLDSLNLQLFQKNDILQQWEKIPKGTLFDLAEIIARMNSSKGLEAIKQAIRAIYKKDYERWLLDEGTFDQKSLSEAIDTSDIGRVVEA